MRTSEKLKLLSLALAALLISSGVALADQHDGDDDLDTVFNLGYDEDNHLLIWNTSPDDSTYDCTLQTSDDPEENAEYEATYGIGDELIPVDALTLDGGDVVFPARDEEDVDTEEFPVATEDAVYAGADGECGLSGGEVAGPNGQINHGQFMKLFNSLYEGTHRGCLNRYLAKSDLGKDDQQLNTNEVDPSFEPNLEEPGSLSFTTTLADCERGKKDADDDIGSTAQGEQGKGKPDSPGKSGSAPGRDK
ncbi:MAG TPA: hypothetical protein VGC03_15755 [Acidimicrobiia bacterium]|jgi:hypothetical protein